MNINRKLAIAIPTYNRAAEIDGNLALLIPMIRKHSVPVYISDNASTDNTEEVCFRHQADYEYVFYSKNENNLGFDANFEKALKLSEAKYTWLLGDDDRITDGSIERVLEETEREYSLIHCEKDKIEKAQTVFSPNDLLSFYGEKCTKISSLIFRKSTISEAEFSTYNGNYFAHWSGFFNYYNLNRLPVRCLHGNLYREEDSGGDNSPAQTYDCLRLFAGKFIDALKELPADVYSSEAKVVCARKISETFVPNRARLARLAGNFDREIYESIKDNLLLAVGKRNMWKYALISVTPKCIIYLYEKQKDIERCLRNRIRKQGS